MCSQTVLSVAGRVSIMGSSMSGLWLISFRYTRRKLSWSNIASLRSSTPVFFSALTNTAPGNLSRKSFFWCTFRRSALLMHTRCLT